MQEQRDGYVRSWPKCVARQAAICRCAVTNQKRLIVVFCVQQAERHHRTELAKLRAGVTTVATAAVIARQPTAVTAAAGSHSDMHNADVALETRLQAAEAGKAELEGTIESLNLAPNRILTCSCGLCRFRSCR